MRGSMPKTKMDRPDSEFKAENRHGIFYARFQRQCSDVSSEGLKMLMYVQLCVGWNGGTNLEKKCSAVRGLEWRNQPRKKHRAQARWTFATKLKTSKDPTTRQPLAGVVWTESQAGLKTLLESSSIICTCRGCIEDNHALLHGFPFLLSTP